MTWLTRWTERLRQTWAVPSLAHVHTSAGVQLAPPTSAQHVLARGLCRFRWIDCSALPVPEQAGFVQLQLASWQPFEEPGWALVLGPQGAMVWAWDAAALAQRCAAANVPAPNAQPWPESALLPPPEGGSGVRLLACVQGFEGQCWRDGALHASHWWPALPEAAQWHNFMRGAGLPPQVLPSPQPVPALAGAASAAADVADTDATAARAATWLAQAQPWAQVYSPASLQAKAQLRWQALALALLLPLLWATVYEGHALWRLNQHSQAVQAQRQQLQDDIGPLLQAREQALANQGQLQWLHQRIAQPTALQVLRHVAQVLASNPALAETVVRELQWTANSQQLRLVLQMPAGVPRVAYVQALEGGGWLHDVRELPAESVANNQWLVLHAQAQGHPDNPKNNSDQRLSDGDLKDQSPEGAQP